MGIRLKWFCLSSQDEHVHGFLVKSAGLPARSRLCYSASLARGTFGFSVFALMNLSRFISVVSTAAQISSPSSMHSRALVGLPAGGRSPLWSLHFPPSQSSQELAWLSGKGFVECTETAQSPACMCTGANATRPSKHRICKARGWLVTCYNHPVFAAELVGGWRLARAPGQGGPARFS